MPDINYHGPWVICVNMKAFQCILDSNKRPPTQLCHCPSQKIIVAKLFGNHIKFSAAKLIDKAAPT